ncbi:MAG: glycosyltransferase [Bacteroidales bacterium]|nr:glycosyltransferase [Bacteroidales bacterium]
MLSILIPVYNFNIVSLVTELHKQASKAAITFEIIVLDDCSSELLRDQNKDVSRLSGVRFYELDKNIGRARIRNRLAGMAIYDSLLFMDCDSELSSEQYIGNYLPYCGKEMVVCGGRVYNPEPPEEPEYLLRWLYGISKEQVPETIRNLNPYRSFMTNNFLVSKNICLQVQFDESIILYGHEDTLFGLELKKQRVHVKHINNPLVHIGLEISREFLRKTEEGIGNLLMLIHDNKIDQDDIKDIRLLKAYNRVKKYRMVRVYRVFYSFIANMVMRNLLGSNPSIFAFDLYKLSLISQPLRARKP